jgi:TetR/AcrR family transcriptional regulator, repressor for uid operon
VRRLDPVKHAEKRREILKAALERLQQEGLRGTSIADICEAADISPGHLYHYFANKEEILAAIFEDAIASGAREFGELIKSSNALSALSAIIEGAKSRNLRKEYMLFLEIAAESGRNSRLGKMLQEGSRFIWAQIAEHIRQGQEAGFIDKSLSPDATAAILYAVLDGVRVMAVRDPKIQMDEILDHLKIMVARFLVPSGGP